MKGRPYFVLVLFEQMPPLQASTTGASDYMVASDKSFATDTSGGLNVFRNMREFCQWVDANG